MLLGKSNSRADQPRGRVAQLVRWHKQPCGKEEALPGTSLQRGHGGPCSPWVDSCGQLAQGKLYRPGAARRRRGSPSSPQHAREAANAWRASPGMLTLSPCVPAPLVLGLPEPQWALTSLLPTSPSQNFLGSQLQKPLPEPLAEIRK